MRTGRILTGQMEVETRQHDMAGLDLGEGPPRRALIFGALALAVWCIALAPFLGVPNRYTFSLYFLPPILLTVIGMRVSGRTPRRRVLTDWALQIRYALLGHRTIVDVGRRRPTRYELPPLAERWRLITSAFGRVVPATVKPPWAQPDHSSEHTQRPVGSPIVLEQRARLLGGDELHTALLARSRKKT